MLWRDNLESAVSEDYLSGSVRKVPPKLFEAGVVVYRRECFELYLQDLFRLAEICLYLVAECLYNVSIRQPHHAITIRIGHQSLLPRGPYLCPSIIFPYSLLPHHLLPNPLPVLFNLIRICWLILLGELRVKGLHGCLIKTIGVIVESSRVNEVVDGLGSEIGQEMDLEDLVSMLLDL